MSKKKKKKNLSNQRKEPYDRAGLLEIVSQLRDSSAKLKALAKDMDCANLEKIEVDGHAMLVRGLDQIANFVDNASKAVRQAKSNNQKAPD